jgi:NADH-quinone oxidoreductase subunit J
MIGAIVLTHRKRDNVKRQDAVKQILRNKEDAIEVKEVEIGKGVL